MSHVVKIRTVFKDFDALVAAAKACGMEFVAGKREYTWFNTWVGDTAMPEGWTWKPAGKPNGHVTNGPRYTHQHDPSKRMLGTCDHVFRVPGSGVYAYEVGAYKNPDGTWGVVWDYYGQSGRELSDRLGVNNDASKLEAAYAIAVAEKTAQAQGWSTRREGGALLIDVYDPVSGTMGTVTVGAGGVDATGFVGGACANPVETISTAIGVQTESQYKPEYYETGWLKQGY